MSSSTEDVSLSVGISSASENAFHRQSQLSRLLRFTGRLCIDSAIFGPTFALIVNILPSFKTISSLVFRDSVLFGFSEPKVNNMNSSLSPNFKFNLLAKDSVI